MLNKKGFQSIFKINNVPILPPVIDLETKAEIKKILEQVKVKELKWQKRKEEKDRENIAKQIASDEAGSMGSRRGSYTIVSPFFTALELPLIHSETSESDKNTVVDGPVSLESISSEIFDNATDKSSKDLKNEIDRRSTPAPSLYEAVFEPQANNQLKDLIEKQKQEYLKAMDNMKNKFTNEQQELIMNLQSNIAAVTSTPLNHSILTQCTSDEDFTEFRTCLQSQSQSLEEKTIVNDHDAKMKASIIINANARGYLTRRLMKTIYVQEHIRNVRETLQLVLNLDDHDIGGSPIQNILLKAKLFRQLQSDLYNFNEIFFLYSIKERMKIISADREIRFKKQAENNNEHLSLSFTGLV